jgi:flagellar protein FlgJ
MRRILLSLLAAAAPIGLLAAPVSAAAATTVTGTARQWVNVRGGPSTASPSVGNLSGNQVVTIACQEVGATVTGPGGSTPLWDRIGEGRYVSHSYITAMTGVPSRCDDLPVTALARQWVNVRSGPSTGSPSVGNLSGGQQVTILCQETGGVVSGPGGPSALWDRVGEGRYVSHSYLTSVLGTPNACNSRVPEGLLVDGPVPAPIAGITAEQAAFINMMAGPARHSFQEYRVPASVTMAQAILESGWGRGDIPRTVNNYFGMKCPAGVPTGLAMACRDFPTKECGSAGCYATTGTFKVYASVLESLRDHALTLSSMKRYAPAFAYTDAPNQFAAEVHRAGYATDPNYTTLLIGIMTKYDLYRYDK